MIELGHCGCIESAGFVEGNWPDACRREITVSHHVNQINIGLWKASLADALKMWENVIDVRFAVLRDFTRNARIWITDGPLPGSTLAWSFLANSNCGSRLEQRYDTTVNWSRDMLTATIVHEIGHALGLTHSGNSADIMYPSITMNTIAPSSGDIRRAVNIGYRRSMPRPPDPPAPPPPKPPTPEPPTDEDPDMDWIALIELILEILRNCQAQSSTDEVLSVLQNRKLAAKWVLRRELRSRGYRGSKLRSAVRDVMLELDDATTEELEELLSDASR